LFGVIFVFYERVDGQELGEWLYAQLEGAVSVPALCSGQELELLISGEYQVATTTHFNAGAEETVRDVAFL